MKEYTIKIEIESPTLLGSGEGWGSIIDSDIAFDKLGLPYFPAKRLKGLLRESAQEVIEMFKEAGIDISLNVDDLFGKPGQKESTPVFFPDLYLAEYAEIKKWLEWALNEHSHILSNEVITGTLTETRQQTAISEKGIAKPHSLRTIRVLKPGYFFEGKIKIKNEDVQLINLLALACINLRHVGTRRNRGFGRISCVLMDGENKLGSQFLDGLQEAKDV